MVSGQMARGPVANKAWAMTHPILKARLHRSENQGLQAPPRFLFSGKKKAHKSIIFFVRLVLGWPRVCPRDFTGLCSWDKLGENLGQTWVFTLFCTVEARQTRVCPWDKPGAEGRHRKFMWKKCMCLFRSLSLAWFSPVVVHLWKGASPPRAFYLIIAIFLSLCFCLQNVIRRRPGKPNQRKGMNFAHFCELWCFP